MHASEVRETVRAAFARYDDDASGAIDARELRRLVQDLGGAMTDSDLRAALRVLDRDRSGSIDMDEFVDWWSAKVADLDGDGAVTELEKTLERLRELGRARFHVDVHTAAWRGFCDVVTRLVQDDSELATERDATDDGNQNTPLHYAAYQGHADVCAVLLEHGANVNAVNGSGCTPVFYAAQQSRESVVSLLLQRGADIKIKDAEHHFSPVDVCHDDAILKLFQSLSGSAPGVPSRPTLSEPGEHHLTVTWTPPKTTLNEVAPISLYKLCLSSATAPPKSVLAPGAATEIVVSDLAPDTSYVCTLAAVNLHGMGDMSAASEPLRTLRARPAAPRDLAVCDADAQSVRLQWALAPEDDGATHIVVQQSLGTRGESGWKVVYKGDASLLSCTIEHLFRDHRYLFRVAAMNSTGTGEFSAPVVARTLAGAQNGPRAETKATRARVVVNALKLFAKTSAAEKPRRAMATRQTQQQEEEKESALENQAPSEAKVPTPRRQADARRNGDALQMPFAQDSAVALAQPTVPSLTTRDHKARSERSAKQPQQQSPSLAVEPQSDGDDDEFTYYESESSGSD